MEWVPHPTATNSVDTLVLFKSHMLKASDSLDSHWCFTPSDFMVLLQGYGELVDSLCQGAYFMDLSKFTWNLHLVLFQLGSMLSGTHGLWK